MTNLRARAAPNRVHVIFLPQVTQRKLYPWTALVILTTLNFLNYIDRSVLFAVQPLVQTEFKLTNTQVGYLTSAFLLFYMVGAVCRPAGRPLFAQADHHSGSGFLERPDSADRGHAHLRRIAAAPHPGGGG